MPCDINALAVAGVRGLHPYEPGKPIEELEREYGIRNAIKLASNENPLGSGPAALAAITNATKNMGRYPDGNAFALKTALAAHYQVDGQQLTIGNGSNDVLELIARAFVSLENEVVFSQYAFAIYPIVTQAVGAEAVVVPAKDWGYDLRAMADAISERTRVVFIANPNNPTGTWLPAAKLESFLNILPDHVLCVVDEAYAEYVATDDYPHTIKWLDRFPNLIVTRTFSKIHGLAGLRVGFAISSPEIADMLNRVRQPFNVNMMALAAAEAAMGDHAHVVKSREMNLTGMKQLTRVFDDLGLDWISSAGNFISVDVRQPGADIYERLLAKGVIVRPLANYQMPNHLRITIGTQEENKKFIETLKKVLVDKSAKR